jgi:hypothetical protein
VLKYGGKIGVGVGGGGRGGGNNSATPQDKNL